MQSDMRVYCGDKHSCYMMSSSDEGKTFTFKRTDNQPLVGNYDQIWLFMYRMCCYCITRYPGIQPSSSTPFRVVAPAMTRTVLIVEPIDDIESKKASESTCIKGVGDNKYNIRKLGSDGRFQIRCNDDKRLPRNLDEFNQLYQLYFECLTKELEFQSTNGISTDDFDIEHSPDNKMITITPIMLTNSDQSENHDRQFNKK